MNIRKGMKVKIKEDLSTTIKNFGIDPKGEMKSMRGSIFTVEYSSEDHISIKGPITGFPFTFHCCDIEKPKVIEVKPKVFEFDASLLDV